VAKKSPRNLYFLNFSAIKTIRAFVAKPHPPKGEITHLKFIEEGKTRILQLD
jgi:hypothetical protein